MERLDTATGIVGGGLISEGSQLHDWERRLAERSEQLYRARLMQRLLLAWALPGNVFLVLVTVTGLALADAPSVGVLLVAAVVPIASIAVSARFLYWQHFKVRSSESEFRELERLHREYLLEELGTGDLLGAHKRYRAQLPGIISGYRVEARQARWKDKALQALVIAGSIVTASATAASVSLVDARWVAFGVSMIVAIAASVAGYGKYRERGVGLQQTADFLEREYQSVELRAGRYRRFSDEGEAYAEFADIVEGLRAEQAKQQHQLGQSGGVKDANVIGE